MSEFYGGTQASNSKLREVAHRYGIKRVDPERKELCLAGLDMCVLNEDDIIYIISGAESVYAAQRRLRAKIKNS